MYQLLTIMGRLGADPTMCYTAEGKPYTAFSVATERAWHDADNTLQKRVVWFKCACWGRNAEIANQYLHKGRVIMVTGTLDEPRPYQGRDGVWRADLAVTATALKFVPEGKPPKDGDEVTASEQDKQGEESALEGFPW
jgi:single-strand DNA-binding protein